MNHKEYRFNLAKHLLNLSSLERREELSLILQSSDYTNAQNQHKEEKKLLKDGLDNIELIMSKEEGRNDDLSFTSYGYGNLFRGIVPGIYDSYWKDGTPGKILESVLGDKPSYYEKIRCLIDIFRTKLRGKTLIDLGCGSSESFSIMYYLAGKAGVHKYIGVDKYSLEGISNADFTLDPNDPRFEIVQKDMLYFLHKRTQTACFVLNAIDNTIISNGPYLDGLFENINRLTLKGDIVFGYESMYLHCLRDFSFKQIYGDWSSPGSDIQIREKQ